MNRERSSGFAVSLTLLTVLVSFFAIHQRFLLRAQSSPREIDVIEVDSGRKSPSRMKGPVEIEFFDFDDSPALLASDETSPGRRVIQALGERTEEESSKPRTSSDLPVDVPAPAETPTNEAAAKSDKADGIGNSNPVRDVIEHELSHATREERDIWYDELKSLPAGVVRDLLQVRKQLHTLPRILGGLPERIASSSPAASGPPMEIPAEPASQKIRYHSSSYTNSVASIETAISQLQHNLANAHTTGFKRLRVALVDACQTGDGERAGMPGSRSSSFPSRMIQGDGCRAVMPSLDLKQGGLKKSGRPLDLAIDGEGFFVVRSDDKEFLTRCGALSIDRNRQLCLELTEDMAVIQPPVIIPLEVREIQIAADGVVSVIRSNGASPTVCGQLQLGRVPCPSRLQPMGRLLFAANDTSGSVVVAPAMSQGLGEIHQGFLEGSNVDFESEILEIEDLSKLLKSLPVQTARSVTASSQPESANR